MKDSQKILLNENLGSSATAAGTVSPREMFLAGPTAPVGVSKRSSFAWRNGNISHILHFILSFLKV